jgi:hypothetical protein
MGLPAVAASPTGAASMTHYNFESGAQGWTGVNVAVSQDRTRAAHGAASLRLSRKADATRAITTLRANDGHSALRDLARPVAIDTANT